MRKVRIIEHISLDGVVQGPGGPGEDPSDGFAYSGWSAPYGDPVLGEAIDAAHGDRLDLLLGRHTYDIWSGYWPTVENQPIADLFNQATKYVATHRPDDLPWGPAQDLGDDIVAGVRAIKAEDGPDLIVWGSSTLTPVLLRNGLADEVVLLVYPVLLGAGKRFLDGDGAGCELALVGSRTTATGVVISTYTPVGPVRTGDAAA